MLHCLLKHVLYAIMSVKWECDNNPKTYTGSHQTKSEQLEGEFVTQCHPNQESNCNK